MIDLSELKMRLDCREVVEREIGAPKRRGAQDWRWRCPFHNGKDANFAAWREGWKCHSQCNASGDVVQFIMQWRGLDFKAACEHLGAAPDTVVPLPRPQPPRPQAAPALTPDLAMKLADIVARSQAKLWDSGDTRGLDYLTGRGLLPDTIRAAQLGYIPDDKPGYQVHGLYIRPGILIPSFQGGRVQYVQFRAISTRHPKQPRYIGITGIHATGSLFGGDDLQPFKPAFVFEGAFNALIARQLGYQAVATSSAGNTIAPAWFGKLLTLPLLLVWFDANEAGREGTRKHLALSPNFKAVQPLDHDLNELYLQDPALAGGLLAQWVKAYQQTQDDLEAYALTLGGCAVHEQPLAKLETPSAGETSAQMTMFEPAPTVSHYRLGA